MKWFLGIIAVYCVGGALCTGSLFGSHRTVEHSFTRESGASTGDYVHHTKTITRNQKTAPSSGTYAAKVRTRTRTYRASGSNGSYAPAEHSSGSTGH